MRATSLKVVAVPTATVKMTLRMPTSVKSPGAAVVSQMPAVDTPFTDVTTPWARLGTIVTEVAVSAPEDMVPRAFTWPPTQTLAKVADVGGVRATSLKVVAVPTATVKMTLRMPTSVKSPGRAWCRSARGGHSVHRFDDPLARLGTIVTDVAVSAPEDMVPRAFTWPPGSQTLAKVADVGDVSDVTEGRRGADAGGVDDLAHADEREVPRGSRGVAVPAVDTPFTDVTTTWRGCDGVEGFGSRDAAPAPTTVPARTTTTATGTSIPRCDFFILLNMCGLLFGARKDALADHILIVHTGSCDLGGRAGCRQGAQDSSPRSF